MTDRAAQLKYEEDSDAFAAAERLQQLQQDANAGDVNLPRAQRYIARAYSDVRASLEAVLAIPTRGVGGKFKMWLRQVPLDVAAVLALREVIGTTMSQSIAGKGVCTIQNLATAVGRLYELEVRIAEAEQVNPLYIGRVHDQVKEHATTSKTHLRRLYQTAYDAVMKEGADVRLSQSDLMQLGKFGVQACMDAGVLFTEHSYGKGGTVVNYQLNPEVREYLMDYNDGDVAQVLNRATGWMRCPPDNWATLNDGGYVSSRRKLSAPLMHMGGIRKAERKRIREAFTAEKMPLVFECANYMQSIPARLHPGVMQHILRIWREGGGALGIPKTSMPVKPELPLGQDWIKADGTPAELDIFTAWKFQVSTYYTNLKNWRSKVREISGFIKTTNDQPGDVYFPMFFDTRGRWYYRGHPNPQGSDMAKAAIQFSRKLPLGKRGVFWLKVAIANSYGFDKKRMAVRAAWTEERWEAIKAGLSAPENCAIFTEADSPWCMFAAALELFNALESGDPEAYCTGVVVHMDATCSGLQHFSAMQRDPIGGGYVNLYDAGGDEKQDIYARVGKNATAVITYDAKDPEKKPLADFWISAGIPRGLAKKPVMTYCYGATLRGTSTFVGEYLRTEMDLKCPEGMRMYDCAMYASKKLFTGIEVTVPAAAGIMKWLRGIAQQMPKGKRMEWTTPTGFKVQHDYQDYTEARVKLRSCGVVYTIIREYNEDTVSTSMQGAIAPNFVHALDASHMTLTALDMKAQGHDMFGIHDSFGTHPSAVDDMHVSIRKTFCNMYTEHNVLANFLWEVGGIGEVPMRGTLDLRKVLESEFAFS